MTRFWVLAFFISLFISSTGVAQERFCKADFLALFENKGKEPTDFVISKFDDADLLIFDDALHNLAEPWDFYASLFHNPNFLEQIDVAFLEVTPLNKQPALDAFFASDPKDQTLLYPAFQNRTGWNYKSYFDLLDAIYEANKSRPEENKIKVIAVSNPSYWAEIKTREDVRIYNEAGTAGRDNLMYRLILSAMDGFNSGKKGIFLTNTRHAYTGLRDKEGKFIWNTGTFFHQWNTGKTVSIRFHAPYLQVKARKTLEEGQMVSAEGLEEFEIGWGRPAKGAIDEALEDLGRPVALEISGNLFGRLPYLGNLMLQAAPGQSMADVYDAMIFLEPIDTLEVTGEVDFIYTEEFKKELARRLPLLFSDEQITSMMQSFGVEDLGGLTEAILVFQKRGPHPQAAQVGPKGEWRKDCPGEK